jgi:archaellum component FlaF (FlaF/FlaG flagellin family)
MRNTQLLNQIILIAILVFGGCKYNQKNQQAEKMTENYVFNNEQSKKLNNENISQELMMEFNISENLSNRIARFFNVNYTQLNIVFKNTSNNEIVFQYPISEWNLHLSIFDNKNKQIYSNSMTFVQFLIDDSFYIVLNPNESKEFKKRISYFGNFKTSFKEIRKLRLDYMAQPEDRNADFDNFIENSSTEIEIN